MVIKPSLLTWYIILKLLLGYDLCELLALNGLALSTHPTFTQCSSFYYRCGFKWEGAESSCAPSQDIPDYASRSTGLFLDIRSLEQGRLFDKNPPFFQKIRNCIGLEWLKRDMTHVIQQVVYQWYCFGLPGIALV